MPLQTAPPALTPEEQCLIVLELDGILWASPPHGADPGSSPVPRPYVQTLLDYLLHPHSLFRTAFWTGMPRSVAITSIKQLDLDIFAEGGTTLLDDGILALWGSEETGIGAEQWLAGAEREVKDLDVLWASLNLDRSKTGCPAWSSINSVLVDDIVVNSTSRSGSVIPAPRYSTPGDRNDEFLLGLIGVLETLADTSKNFEKSLKTLGLDGGVPPKDFDSYVAKAEEICGRLGVKVSRGRGTYNADYVSIASKLDLPIPHGPPLDPLDEISEKKLDCIFCSAKVKATFKMIQQTDEFIAFFSHAPSSPVHVLCIPHFHVQDCSLLRQDDLPWLEDLVAYGKDAYRKSCKAAGLAEDHPCRLGFHVPPSTTVNHLHLHLLALPGPDLEPPVYTVAEKKKLDWHHTPAPVYRRSETYSNRLQNLLGDGTVSLVAKTGALFLAADDLLAILRSGGKVESRALKKEYFGGELQIAVTRVPA